MIMMFLVCCGKIPDKPGVKHPIVLVDGRELKCPCSAMPEHIYIMGDIVEARCTACLHCEYAYLIEPEEFTYGPNTTNPS